MSRFVSGGTADEPIQRDEAWLKAQEEIEARRRQKEEEGRQDGGKSLYDVLQANKAAKQDAFEESTRLKNQFRSLDQDEVEFLDSVLESTRAKEDAVRKETVERLEAFRRQQQEDSEKATIDDTDPETNNPSEKSDTWAVNARKRKRGRERDAIAGLKLRKSSSTAATEEQPPQSPAASTPAATKSVQPHKPAIQEEQRSEKKAAETLPAAAPSTVVSPKPAAPASVALGLAAYSSDED